MKKTALIGIWLCLTGVISPLWTGLIYMNLTGHGKGYAYDMGSEADIAVAFGIILLALWLLAVFPAMLWLCKRFFAGKRQFAFLPVFGFFVLFGVGIALLGWNAFIRLFGFGYAW